MFQLRFEFCTFLLLLTIFWSDATTLAGRHDGIHGNRVPTKFWHSGQHGFTAEQGTAQKQKSDAADRTVRKNNSRTTSDEPITDSKAEDPGTQKKIPLTGPSIAAFEPFSEFARVFQDGGYLVVECDGLPQHDMMVGIRAWQQQVPLPQPFSGENAWRLPLQPTQADQPISVLQKPLRGAIALAVNGVPIFCALNNRSEDTFLAGELDQWGGHCGRGDDYHYHIAPVHLEKKVGIGNPIAFALDGYPILGLTEADGSRPTDLDEFNGHEDEDGNYHYHATRGFPYVNGGLRGAVDIRGDEIHQPKGTPVRPAQQPLRGATITRFGRDKNEFEIEYEINNQTGQVNYKILDEETFEFTFIPPDGRTSTVVYQRGRTDRPFLMRNWFWVIPVFIALLFSAAIFVRRWRFQARSGS